MTERREGRQDPFTKLVGTEERAKIREAAKALLEQRPPYVGLPDHVVKQQKGLTLVRLEADMIGNLVGRETVRKVILGPDPEEEERKAS